MATSSYHLELLREGRMPFGKYKNVPFAEVPKSYLRWYLSPAPAFDKEVVEPVQRWVEENDIDLTDKLPDPELSQHFGTIGKRVKVFLKVVDIGVWKTGNYGQYRVIKFLDRDNNRFLSFSSTDWIEGHFYQMKITPKTHTEFRGVKETVFGRPHIIKQFDSMGAEY